jgi:hypothetical protein
MTTKSSHLIDLGLWLASLMERGHLQEVGTSKQVGTERADRLAPDSHQWRAPVNAGTNLSIKKN